MESSDQEADALRLLAAVEGGGVSRSDMANLAESLDPVLTYLLVSFLRAVYPLSDPAASPVLKRVVELSAGNPELISRYNAGRDDPVSRWFESEYDYRTFRCPGGGSDLVRLIIDKLEG